MHMKRISGEESLAAFVDRLQGIGRYSFTLREVRALPGRSETGIQVALGRLKQQGRIVSPRRGFFVIVPIEYRSAGSPPAAWFIDALMGFMEQPYYVGLLSAAALHGAAHQQPMAFQVITDRATRPSSAARVRIEYHVNRAVESVPVEEMQTETGSMRVSTPAVTAFDLVRYAGAAGHLSNVATVLLELAETLSPDALADVASLYSAPDAQRLGYLLEAVGQGHLTAPLRDRLSMRRHRVVRLAPGRPAGRRKVDHRWRIIPNTRLEVDR